MKNIVIIILFLAGFLNLSATAQELVNLSNAQIKAFVDTHNQWRSDVGTDDLKWSKSLAEYAAEWGMNLGKSCNMQHRPRTGKWEQKHGENLYWTSANSADPVEVVDAWGSEIQYYKKAKPIKANLVPKYGHYTQMIWKNTTEVGCAIIECKKGGTIVVCNYNPPGNWLGETAY